MMSSLGNSSLPLLFDWRDRHGENWMSPVKDQGGAGTCAKFSATAMLESQINLYYNQHLDVDLSEQMANDCINARPMWYTFLRDDPYSACSAQQISDCPGFGGYGCIFNQSGLAIESCDPYREDDVYGEPEICEAYVCPDWQDKVWGKAYGTPIGLLWDWEHDYCPNLEYSDIVLQFTQDNLKETIIKYGPLNSIIGEWNHAVLIAGYSTDDFGNMIIIFKNSWGTWWGEQGYGQMPYSEFSRVYGMKTNIIHPPIGESYEIACVDNDNDGYCNWGISDEKPATCSPACNEEPDCNDADSSSFYFGADDICDGLDNNCNGLVDEDCELPEIVVNETCTICPTFCLSEVFGHWQPLGFYVDCTVQGDPARTYNVNIVLKATSLGEKLVKKYKKQSPGDNIAFRDFVLIDDGDAFGTHKVQFVFKLKKAGVLLYKEVITKDISVIEDYEFSEHCPYKYDSDCIGRCGM